MNSIQISINNLNLKIDIIIDLLNNKVIIDDKPKDISREKIDELLRIIRTWKNEYISNNFIDAESFLITINIDGELETIRGSGLYPENYSSLKEWIGDIYE